MGQISWTGAFNPTTLTVPDVYLNVVPPGTGIITPASSGVLGVVGVASWGPKNVPTPIANTPSKLLFGPQPVVRANDLLTGAQIALDVQSAANIGGLMGVRVTDGTDAAASAVILATGVTLTSIYTGTFGNQTSAVLSVGSQAGTFKVVVQLPGFTAEVFDNIGLGKTGNAIWLAIAAAINMGIGGVRGPSVLITAAAGALSTAPTGLPLTSTFTGGLDGATTITSSVLVGADTAGAPTGIYAFRGTGISDLNVMDLADPTQEAALITYGQSEGTYVHMSGPVGESVSAAVTAMGTSASNNPFGKRLIGDWIYWQDNFNAVQRLVAPGIFSGAQLSSQPIQGSGLNQPFTNIVATQRSRSGVPYGNVELGSLVSIGVDAICKPIPRGNQFGLRTGHNTSSDASRHGDNYPRLTSWLARTLAGPSAFGPFIGRDITDQFFLDGFDTANNFMLGLKLNGVIQDYSILFDRTNNPQSQTAQGIVIAQINVVYFGIAEIFLVNLKGGQTVVLPATSSYSFGATSA